jgi:endonuclease/exonuclease/phosphatase family metal-dependent hydrolase
MEVKVMTYNVHSCCGKDRRALPSSIAEVIALNDPDIIALQELDVGLRRSGFADQAAVIARQLGMYCRFSAALTLEQGEYGNAVFSRYPLSVRKAGELPTLEQMKGIERRGAIWAEVTVKTQKIQFFNTHLGLRRTERMLQINRLAGPEWLDHPDCKPPVIFCGDLNALPGSSVVKRISGMLNDVQVHRNSGGRQRKTYPSMFPLFRIDYVFVSRDVEVINAIVPDSRSIRKASDHLPLVATLMLPEPDRLAAG